PTAAPATARTTAAASDAPRLGGPVRRPCPEAAPLYTRPPVSSAPRDYYTVLGVARDVDAAGLKAAYRKLVIQYHPDRNPGDTEAEARFREATEAYTVLSDEERRKRYD